MFLIKVLVFVFTEEIYEETYFAYNGVGADVVFLRLRKQRYSGDDGCRRKRYMGAYQ